MQISYGEAIREGFAYLLSNYPNVFTIGQGLWSPWYVGESMKDLDKEFGKKRVIDTPVSEMACTGIAIGASLCNKMPIVIHPRVDFLILAIDQIVNQAAKWSHMFGGQAHPSVTIRGIVNRGGEQGAQHSQSLHSWFSHIPGLRVVMPATVSDARDLLILSTLCNDPVVFIDDRWLYNKKEEVKEFDNSKKLQDIKPQIIKEGSDITLVGISYSISVCEEVAETLKEKNISSEIIDTRILNPFDPTIIIESVKKTKKLVVIDSAWKNCGFSAEVIASCTEAIDTNTLSVAPIRHTLPSTPAPTSKALENIYYPDSSKIAKNILKKCF